MANVTELTCSAALKNNDRRHQLRCSHDAATPQTYTKLGYLALPRPQIHFSKELSHLLSNNRQEDDTDKRLVDFPLVDYAFNAT